LLTQTRIKANLPKHKTKIICLDRLVSPVPLHPCTSASQQPTSQNLAYTIYTSGSTGKPKGVAIEHHSALNTIVDINRRFQIDKEDKVLCLSSLSFDLSVYDIFGLLGIGGTLVIPTPSPSPNPGEWLDLILKNEVTIWNTAPAVMELFANYLSDRNESLPKSLRLILMSGDRIPVNLPVQLKKISKNQKLQIISLGGATEASIWSIIYPIEKNDPQWTSIPYGRPLNNQSFYILDRMGQPAPIGIPGEIHIGGIDLARCYLNRLQLTEEKFIPTPHTIKDRSTTRGCPYTPLFFKRLPSKN
jgi:non-ribosomal peptide synthetase component F